MKRYDQISAFILSGGASSRMGKAKGLLEFAGEPLIVRTARMLQTLVPPVTVVGSPETHQALGLHAIADRDFGCPQVDGKLPGPLAGIASALAGTGTTWNLILACDLPYLTTAWLDWLLARSTNSEKQIVIPRTSRGLEPLAAVYRRECAAPIAASLISEVRKVTDALEQFRIEVVSENDWRAADSDGRILRNMNTQAEYEEARKWLERA